MCIKLYSKLLLGLRGPWNYYPIQSKKGNTQNSLTIQSKYEAWKTNLKPCLVLIDRLVAHFSLKTWANFLTFARWLKVQKRGRINRQRPGT